MLARYEGRYTRVGVPGASMGRPTHRTMILGGVAASKYPKLSSIHAFGTLPLKHSMLI